MMFDCAAAARGQVEANESPEAALVRELREELAVSVDPAQLQPITFASHTYEKFHLLMPVRMRLCTRLSTHTHTHTQLKAVTLGSLTLQALFYLQLLMYFLIMSLRCLFQPTVLQLCISFLLSNRQL
jgi:8-oxo-dGTP pyrophosphatase MutT (NUDIX family)